MTDSVRAMSRTVRAIILAKSGNFSGPKNTSAMAAMTMSSDIPILPNMCALSTRPLP